MDITLSLMESASSDIVDNVSVNLYKILKMYLDATTNFEVTIAIHPF